MTTLFLDTETFGETPIKNGTFRYAADAEVLAVAYAIDEGPVQVWDVTSGDRMPADLGRALADRSVPITAHNAQFDATVLWLAKNSDEVMRAAGEKIERWRCTMAQALSHSLPAKLSALGAVLHLPAEMLKDDGADLIRLFCMPLRTGSLKRATAKTHPEQWQRFLRYAGQDIVAMRECARRMPKWNWQARDIACWHLDQRINRRGFAVDVDLAEAAIDICSREAKDNAAKTEMLTGGTVEKVTQRDRLMKHVLLEHGVDLPDLRATTVERRIEDPDLPWAVRELLSLRLSGSKNSISKYRSAIRAVSVDGRLRGALQFRGASRTGRDAGRLFQPQNLPRPKHKAAIVETWIGAAKAGCTGLLGFDDVQLAGDALRGLIVPGAGRKIVQADFANIEGRLVAWYAGVQWTLQAFREFDAGTGPDLYRVTAGRAFNKPVAAVTDDERQIGKVIILACGFGGGVGAFQTMAAVYGVEVTDQRAQQMVDAWRRAHPEVVRLWYRIDECARLAIQNPDKVFEVNDKIRLARRGPWLKVQLPSGRILSYPHVGFSVHGEITYMGQDQYTRKWQALKTYGGKLCIAAGTPVLTHRGWVPIEMVASGDRVWDGVEWVGTAGAVFKGRRETVNAYGARMTGDHKVLTVEGWKDASQSARYRRAACRLPDGVTVPRVGRTPVDVADSVRLRSGEGARGERTAENARARGVGFVRLQEARDAVRKADFARHEYAPGLRGLPVDASAVREPFASRMAQLRRAWHHGVLRVAGILQRVLAGHGADLRARTVAGAHGQQQGILAAELPVGHGETTGEQHAHERAGWRADCGSTSGRLGVGPVDRVLPCAGRGADAPHDGGAGHHEEVFDLMDCGPRNRFVIAAGRGPLIVHNCENIVQATAADLLWAAIPKAEAAGYPVVLRVHDELLTEPLDDGRFNVEGLAKLMTDTPAWAAGLPVAAAGFEAQRYRK